MANITLEGVSKHFGAGPVIDDISMEIPDKEFVVLLGPSGCGKSTLLRLIAGLADVSAGSIYCDGEWMNDLPPLARDLAVVFQSYALYPSMSVRRNIAFPLMMREFKWWYHVPAVGWLSKRRLERRPEIARSVEKAAELLEIAELLDRMPRTLSGGQRQRVALGRAIVREPRAFLMDEPLSNLDAKLRVQMRGELIRLHQRMRRTFIYVTHDQTEAMTMGTRIAVMNAGKIQQYGTPREVFERPANVFVARFVGSPPMSVLDCVLRGDNLEIAGEETPAPDLLRRLRSVHGLPGGKAKIGLRSEHVTLRDLPAAGSLSGVVTTVEHLGSETLVGVALGRSDPSRLQAGDTQVFARLDGYAEIPQDSVKHVELDFHSASYFDPSSETRLELCEPNRTAPRRAN